jgi:hypothetical protein
MNLPPHNPPDLAPVNFPQPRSLHATDDFPTTQQAYGAYDVDGTLSFALQAQFSSEHYGITQAHPLHMLSLSPALHNDKQHNAEPVGDFQPVFTAPASPMGPPAQPRKRKAPTLRADDWEPHKHRVLELHLTQELPLPEVRKRMEDDYGFIAKYVASADRRQSES